MTEFDTVVTRRGSDSFKWDDNKRMFGKSDLMPFWVADMDFETPRPILDAIVERTRHPVLGYEMRSDEYVEAVLDWLQLRHGWSVPRDWLMFCPPSSIVGMYGIINSLTRPGESIIVPTPNYQPLLNLVADNGRRLLADPLPEEALRYALDAERLNQRVEDDTRLLIISNPHNPTGRVFSRTELESLAALAESRDLIVISDEVHCDLVLPGFTHIPYGTVGGERSVTVISPNKTFNTAGIPQATLIIPDAGIRESYREFLNMMQLNHDSTFGAVGMLAGYRECGDWLDRVIDYIDGNHRFVADYLEAHIPGVRKVPAEGTYLAWLDFRALQRSEAELVRLLVDKGGVALYAGSEFGPHSDGFFRMNIACPRALLEQGLDGIRRALV